jgi:RNA polymerase sigma-70 factor (ECF subfamily)
VIQVEEFERVYRAHRDLVFRHALRVVGRRDVAEEITGDAFLTLFERRANVTTGMLPGWLITFARRRAIDYWRHREVEQRHEATAPTGETVEPGESPEFWLERVSALKPVHRACLVLRYVHGMERGEVASMLGLTEMQVKGLLQYARELVRRALAVQS